MISCNASDANYLLTTGTEFESNQLSFEDNNWPRFEANLLITAKLLSTSVNQQWFQVTC